MIASLSLHSSLHRSTLSQTRRVPPYASLVASSCEARFNVGDRGGSGHGDESVEHFVGPDVPRLFARVRGDLRPELFLVRPELGGVRLAEVRGVEDLTELDL